MCFETQSTVELETQTDMQTPTTVPPGEAAQTHNLLLHRCYAARTVFDGEDLRARMQPTILRALLRDGRPCGVRRARIAATCCVQQAAARARRVSAPSSGCTLDRSWRTSRRGNRTVKLSNGPAAPAR